MFGWREVEEISVKGDNGFILLCTEVYLLKESEAVLEATKSLKIPLDKVPQTERTEIK